MATTWQAEIKFGERWIVVASGFEKRYELEWLIANWKIQYGVEDDDGLFRYSQIDSETPK